MIKFKSHTNWFLFFGLSMIILSWIQCANPVMPTGGPKDMDPPIILEEDPPRYSTGFKKDRIELTFNEFVELKDAQNQILFSPPLTENPDYRLHGKSIVIKFNDTLSPNTTYNIFFGNAIVDLTEGNPLTNYRYAFSTGDYIDSMSVKGNVMNAFNLLSEPDVFVMLYLDNNDTLPFDSLPYYVRPYYVAKTSEFGDFSLENLQNKPYKIFALSDVNSNLTYDLPNEKIAFLDSLVVPEFIEKPLPDSIRIDTIPMDSIPIDTLLTFRQILDTLGSDTLIIDDLYGDSLIAQNFYQLYLFDEIDSTQKLLEVNQKDSTLLTFIYAFPPENPLIRVINHNMDSLDWKIPEFSKNRDTINFWIKDMPFDTLMLEISDDTLVLDTSRIVFKEEKKNRNRKDKNKERSAPEIAYKTNIKGGSIDLHRPLKMNFSYPVLEADLENWILITAEDTTLVQPYFTDSARRKLVIEHKWEEEKDYALIFADSLLFDLLGHSQDSVYLAFKSKALADYGIITLNFTPGEYCPRYIIQLMNEDESKIFDERIIDQTEMLRYEYLQPGKYKIKAICDRNHNGHWDTGDYILGIQPESVFYFPKIIDLRANWEIEEEWNLNE